MARNFKDFINAYIEYAAVTEAPKRMHFWSAVSAIAGCLRRHVWIDQKRFTWYPSFYIVFVAKPGIVSKSTTIDISMSLLREVPEIKFGPDIVTWQSLVTSFAGAHEQFRYIDKESGEIVYIPQSPMTLAASELGNLIQPLDREMVNLYIDLWDGRKKLEKQTKLSGNDSINAPFINLIGCTTPHWVADNMPPATVGGGFTSRCVFIYADKKEQHIPWVDEMVGDGDLAMRAKLIEDLTDISVSLTGPYTLTPAARDWGRVWYPQHWDAAANNSDSDIRSGYDARKQTHICKLAMVLSASRGDSMEITAEDLETANMMLEDTEPDMEKVFAKIGKSMASQQAERFIQFVVRKKIVSYEEAYKFIHAFFPDHKEFEGIFTGAIRSGQVYMVADAYHSYFYSPEAWKLKNEAKSG